MKKQLVKIGVLALLVSSVAGCSNKLNPSSSSVASNPPISSYPSSPSSQIDLVTVDPAIPDEPSYPSNVLDEYIEYTLVRNNTAYQISKFSPLYEGIESITLPDTYLGKSIVSIGTEAFLDVKTLSSIIIPDTITSIGSRAFKDCSNLTSIYLPSSILLIEENAFRGCSSLTIYSNYQIKPSGWNSKWNPSKRDIYWANSWVYEGEEIKSVFESNISDSIYTLDLNSTSFFTYIDKGDYYEVSGLSLDYDGRSYVKIPDSYSSKPVKSIGLNAFANTALKNIIIPNSITTIGETAFKSTSLLDKVYIGNSVVTIEESAFSDCPSLRKFQVNSTNENYKSIDGVLFSKDSSSIVRYPSNKDSVLYTIPDSVIEISSYAFEGNKKINSLNLPDSVSTIRSNAFTNNSTLTIYTNASAKKPGWETEWKPTSLPVYWRNSWSIQDGSTPTSIFDSEFDDSTYDLELQPDNFFRYSDKGDSIEITGLSTNYDGRPYIKIPSSFSGKPVTSIGNKAFEHYNFKNIIIPDTVISIGESAFYECSSLVNVIIPDSVTSIGIAAFRGCASLVSVKLPDSLASIVAGVFYDCESLVSIALPESINSIGNAVFYNCTSLANIIIPESVISIGSSVFSGCRSLANIILPDSLISIGMDAFSSCISLTSITIPNLVVSIGESAFSNCESLTSIIISESVDSIKNSTFSGCRALTSIILPDSVKSIGSYAFASCESLASIAIPLSVESIGVYAFANCYSLTTIIVPDSLTTSWSAFYATSVIIYTYIDFASLQSYHLFDDGHGDSIKVYYLGQWSLIDGVPTPN
jgi:hypothetical protein